MTLGYLITSNPLAAILSYIAMHIAAVLHGLVCHTASAALLQN